MQTLPTPTLLVDDAKLDANIARMQAQCDRCGVQLWPHIKTHKTVEIARRQLAAGAAGLVCAKLGEAEAMLPSGVRRIFLAYPLVDPPVQSRRVRALAETLDQFLVAATSVAQTEALGRVLDAAEVTLPVLAGVDSGLGREGARGPAAARALAEAIRRHPRMELVGLFTHEGHAYRPAENPAVDEPMEIAKTVAAAMNALRDDIDSDLTLWPGCSVTAMAMATQTGIHAVRPGTYVFGDLGLVTMTGRMTLAETALSVLSTVVDRPEPGLALVDCGSKTLSGDSLPDGTRASDAEGRDIHLRRLSEEHGFATGSGVDALKIGDRIRWTPAHVCPAVNLADILTVVRDGAVLDRWPIAARGKVW